MSGSPAATETGNGGGQEFDAPTRARLMGWRPREEWKRDPSQWKSAEEFLAGMDSPAVLADRYKNLETRSINTERELQGVRAQLGEALTSLRDVTELTRNSEKRAYERAVRELQRKQDEAAATGDTATYQAAKTELEEVRKGEPKAPPVRTEADRPAGGQPTGQQPGQEPAEVSAWKRDNPWYLTDNDMQAFADGVHINLTRQQPGLTMSQNLAKVREMTARAYPEKFGGERPDTNGGGNPRREDPASVTPSAGGDQGRRQTTKRTFEAMPKESRDAFVRYAKQLDGKGKPLTKEEWAASYWSQFEEVE